MKSKIILIFCLAQINVFSQIGSSKVNIKTPNVSDFIRYGNLESASFNGELNTTIPLFSVPVNLQNPLDVYLGYNSSGFIPSKRSGIVGLNWHLNVGGVITREVNGVPDDQLGEPTTFNLPAQKFEIPNGFIAGIKLQQISNPNSYYNNDNIFINPLNYGMVDYGSQNVYLYGVGNTLNNVNSYEANPDIFSFNFNGISGKFFMGYDGQIKVITTEPNSLKIDLTNMSSQYYHTNECANNFLNSEIKITDNVGNIYSFGGLSKYLEYTIPMQSPKSGGGIPTITSWFLKKIEYYETQSNIDFIYKDDGIGTQGFGSGFCESQGTGAYWHGISLTDPKRSFFSLTEQISEDTYDYDLNITSTNWGFSIFPPTGFWTQTHTETSGSVSGSPTNNYSLQKKAILESIIGSDFRMNFNYSYQGFQFNNYVFLGGLNTIVREPKLDNIILIDKNNIQINKFEFLYSIKGGVVATNSYPRLFLDKVVEIGKPAYVFDYYIDPLDLLPRPSTCAIDHWGFWNGKVNNDSGNFHSFNLIPNTDFTPAGDYSFTSDIRDPFFLFSIKGMLKKITYPTQGYSEFEYEPHTYSKRLERRSINGFLPQLYDVNGIVGGTRIKKITDFDGIFAINIKEYKYQNNYPSTISSGILLQWPRYTIALKAHFCCGNNGGDKWWAHRNSNNINKNIIESSVINYSEVIEVMSGNGYTINKYKDYITNPDKGIYNSDYKINKVFYTTDPNSQGGVSFDLPDLEKNLVGVFYNDISTERGKILWQKSLDNFNNLKLQTDFIYNNDLLKYNKYVAFASLTGTWLQTLKLYYSNEYLNEKNTTTYSNTGSIVTSNKFTYSTVNNYSTNTSNQEVISKKSTLSSFNNEIIETQYKYPWNDYLLTSTNYLNFKAANIASPTRESQFRNGIKLSEQFTLYAKDASTNNILLPKSIYSAKFPNSFSVITDVGALEKKMNYDLYDTKGNVTQFTQESGVPVALIWGYNQTELIAKLENVTYSSIPLTTITDLISKSNADVDITTEQTLRNALNVLRTTYPNAMITTYTYNPLVGVTSVTDAKGDIVSYFYDTNNRLMIVKDKNGNVLSQYQYQYKN